MHGREAGPDDLHDRVCLVANRAGAGEAGDLGVDVEEAGDATGGRCVHDDGVVQRLAVRALTTDSLLALAGQEYVADARRDGGREVDGAHLAKR